MTKPDLIKSIKAKSGICLSIAYLESLSLDKLKKLYEKYVPKIKAEKGK
jgi:hypothetical protein